MAGLLALLRGESRTGIATSLRGAEDVPHLGTAPSTTHPWHTTVYPISFSRRSLNHCLIMLW